MLSNGVWVCCNCGSWESEEPKKEKNSKKLLSKSHIK